MHRSKYGPIALSSSTRDQVPPAPCCQPLAFQADHVMPHSNKFLPSCKLFHRHQLGRRTPFGTTPIHMTLRLPYSRAPWETQQPPEGELEGDPENSSRKRRRMARWPLSPKNHRRRGRRPFMVAVSMKVTASSGESTRVKILSASGEIFPSLSTGSCSHRTRPSQ